VSLTVLAGCSEPGSSGPPAPSDPLPALQAVPDAVSGGRIVDDSGREVLLRGVNVNAFVEYWQYDEDLFTTYPFTEADADAIAAIGWNSVRLLVSWSRVEPVAGEYDDAYLDQVAGAVAMLRERGIYTLLDLHQDAWGPSLAAPPDEVCEGGSVPAGGWDGAPGWATFDGGEPRCESGGQREFVPAVRAAWRAFLDDAEGPGGVGIQTRYVRMFGHLVSRFASDDSVAGYDVMNEPNVFEPFDQPTLAAFYQNAVTAMREAEEAVGAPRRLFLFEPSAGWRLGFAAPPPFEHDDQVVYSPHIYQEGLPGGSLEEGFARALDEAAQLYQGAPVITGEWGGDPGRAASSDDDYFQRHLAEQDRYRFGANLWTWREACGDPHKYAPARNGIVPEVWGLFEVDCATNTVTGPRVALREVLRKLTVRFAPGSLSTVRWATDGSLLEATGDDAPARNRLELFVPAADLSSVTLEADGLTGIDSVPWFGGTLLYADASGGSWSVTIAVPLKTSSSDSAVPSVRARTRRAARTALPWLQTPAPRDRDRVRSGAREARRSVLSAANLRSIRSLATGRAPETDRANRHR
jgi:endoglycosylceramidase